jgi:hypothetical protein
VIQYQQLNDSRLRRCSSRRSERRGVADAAPSRHPSRRQPRATRRPARPCCAACAWVGARAPCRRRRRSLVPATAGGRGERAVSAAAGAPPCRCGWTCSAPALTRCTCAPSSPLVSRDINVGTAHVDRDFAYATPLLVTKYGRAPRSPALGRHTEPTQATPLRPCYLPCLPACLPVDESAIVWVVTLRRPHINDS